MAEPQSDPGEAQSSSSDERTDSAAAAESFVKTTDAESFVKNFARSPLRKRLRRVFDTFDIDKNGQISLEEVSTMLRTLRIRMPEETVLKMMRSADVDNNGEVDFEEFTQAAEGSEFAELVTAASFPVEIYKILEEGNSHFLSTFHEFIVDIVDNCQREVLAAKVPLTSYGRVHSALEEVKKKLTGSAQELLTAEFTQLRTGALESLNAQREAIETRNKANMQSEMDPILSSADERVADAQAKQAEAEAKAERLQERFSAPDALMTKLEEDLVQATDRIAQIQAKLNAVEGDWGTSYPEALAECTVPPPPLPPNAPYITRALEQRGITFEQFLLSLDPQGTGHVSKESLRRNMLGAGLLLSDELARGTDPLFRELEEVQGLKVDMEELKVMMLSWVPASANSADKAQRKLKDKPPPPGALGRALDRLYTADAHGSRMKYVVELYEKQIKAKEEKHIEALRLAHDKATAVDGSAAQEQEERAKAWDEEREAEKSKHAEQRRALEELLEAEKIARLEEVSKLRESTENATADTLKALREEAEELRTTLKAREAEFNHLSENLRSTKEELQAIQQDREQKQLEVKQTRQEQQDGRAAFEEKLQEARDALRKAESAQPAQGGYYFAAAPTRSAFRAISPGSSPERSIIRENIESLLFDKTRRSPSPGALMVRSQGLRDLSASPAPALLEGRSAPSSRLSSQDQESDISLKRNKTGRQSKGKTRRSREGKA